MQDIAWTLVELGVNIFQGFLVTYFIDHTLKKKALRIWPLPSFLCALSFSALLSLYLFFDMPSFDTWIFIVPLIYSLLFFRNSLKEKLLWNAVLIAVFNGITMAFYYLFISAFGFTSSYLLERNTFRILFLVAINLTLFLALFYLSKRRRYTLASLFTILLFALSHILVVAIIEILFFMHEKASFLDPWLLLAASLALLISVVSLFLYEIMTGLARRNYELMCREFQQEAEIRRLEELRNINESLHRLRHDMKNHIQIARMLISVGRSEESAKYLEQADSSIFSIYSTGCLPLDSELTIKEFAMRRSGIHFEHDLCGLVNAPLSDFELCAIVGNLLDNAMEAIARMPSPPDEPVVALRIHRVRDMLYIECSNPCNASAVRRHNGAFLTSKKDAGHGLGIRNIEDIVQNAQGMCTFTVSKGRFHANLTIPYNTEVKTHDVRSQDANQLLHSKRSRAGEGTRNL